MDASSTQIRVLRTMPNASSSSSSGSGAIAMEVETSTCTWTQSQDAHGHCLLKPRSCYQCLNTKPTSQEICTLTPNGVCMGVSAYDSSKDYRRGSPAAAWPVFLNYFPASNTTYCEHDDVMCSSCFDKSFQNYKTNPSLYCKGYKDCVCVAVCENDVWTNWTQPYLEQALTDAHATGALINCTMEQATPQAIVHETESNLADFVGLHPVKDIYSNADECMWAQSQPYCGTPRTCSDCLNTPVYSGAKCMLHSSGYCTSMKSYVYTKDFRWRGRSNHSIALFPGTNTTYCPSSDATCAQCRQSLNFTQWSSVTSIPHFCIGADGCVCVASCESPLWAPAVASLACNLSAVDRLTHQGSSSGPLSPVMYWSVTALALIGAMILALLGLLCLRRLEQHRAAKRRRPRSPKGPSLELSGWKAMRKKLIETEREFVGEITTIAQFEGRNLRTTSDAAPDPEAEPDSIWNAPASISVQAGDAYRPVSPSRMRH